jgi:hypothetical protein
MLPALPPCEDRLLTRASEPINSDSPCEQAHPAADPLGWCGAGVIGAVGQGRSAAPLIPVDQILSISPVGSIFVLVTC